MRWVTGLAAGASLCVALLAVGYGLDGINDWHEARVVVLAELRAVEAKPGHPNRDNVMISAREQLDAMDVGVWENSVISVLVLAVAVGAFVPLWRRALPSCGAVSLAALVAVTAAVLIAALLVLVVILSPSLMRG
jgi:hypothetical protein